jgi:phosphate transport system permease protein
MAGRDEELRRADRLVTPEEQDVAGPASEQVSGAGPAYAEEEPADEAAGALPQMTGGAPAALVRGLPEAPGAGTVRPPVLQGPPRRRRQEALVGGALFLASAISVLTTVGIVAVLLYEAAAFFAEVSPWTFLTGTTWAPLFQPQHFGVLPLLAGSLLVSLGAAVIALPVGLASAIYLSEYASGRVKRIVKPALEVLAGVPTVVYGYFALTFITPLLRQVWPATEVFNAASASIVMGIMIIPLVASLSEDAMSAVPRALREGAYALGATRLEVSTRTVVPAALSGIVASFILAISRAIGETMIVAIAAGATPNLTLDPFESVQTMTAYIVQVSMGEVAFGSVEYRTIFAVGLTLFGLTLIMNGISIYVLRHFREVYE